MSAGTYSCVMRSEEGTGTLWPRFFHWARTNASNTFTAQDTIDCDVI